MKLFVCYAFAIALYFYGDIPAQVVRVIQNKPVYPLNLH